MKKKAKFAGFGCHIEYHTIDPKKEKAVDCIYSTDDRICQNKKCYYYLSKCFNSSNCSFRLKEKAAEAIKKKNEPVKRVESNAPPKIQKIKCTMPLGCKVFSEHFGEGHFAEYDEATMIMSVQFKQRKVRFLYPNAIIDKNLTVNENNFKCVLRDISKAENG